MFFTFPALGFPGPCGCQTAATGNHRWAWVGGMQIQTGTVSIYDMVIRSCRRFVYPGPSISTSISIRRGGDRRGSRDRGSYQGRRDDSRGGGGGGGYGGYGSRRDARKSARNAAFRAVPSFPVRRILGYVIRMYLLLFVFI